jgi:hypothetical protein
MRRFRKPVGSKGSREFESPPLRYVDVTLTFWSDSPTGAALGVKWRGVNELNL